MYAKLRNETQKELEEWLKIANDPKNKSLSKNQLRPAFSASYNTKTGNYFYAKNLTKDEVIAGKTVYHPYVNDRIMTMDKKIYEAYKDMTHGAGSHAECLTLNESMLDQFCIENNIERSALTQKHIDNLYSESPELFNQDPHDTIINVVNSSKLNNTDLAVAGNPMPRCPHCKYVTFKADVLDEVSQAEIELYSKKYPDLKFDK